MKRYTETSSNRKTYGLMSIRDGLLQATKKRQSFADRSGQFLQGVRHCQIKGTDHKVPFSCFFKELIWLAYQLQKKLFPLLFKWMDRCQTQPADTFCLLQGSMPGPKLFNMYVSDLQNSLPPFSVCRIYHHLTQLLSY